VKHKNWSIESTAWIIQMLIYEWLIITLIIFDIKLRTHLQLININSLQAFWLICSFSWCRLTAVYV